MGPFSIFTNIVILFVAVNLAMLIYNAINQKMIEGLTTLPLYKYIVCSNCLRVGNCMKFRELIKESGNVYLLLKVETLKEANSLSFK